jgi:hypothetical protein
MNGVVYISEDEGMNWRVVDDIPGGEAFQFVPHPFDDRMASMSVFQRHALTTPLGICVNKKNDPLRNRRPRAYLEKL